MEIHSFDLDRREPRIGLPAPSGIVELTETCGPIASLPLYNGQPLWEMWVIEGIAGADAREGGRLAVMSLYLVSVDGVGSPRLLSQCAAPNQTSQRRKFVNSPGDANDRREMAVRGLAKFTHRPLRLATVGRDGVNDRRRRVRRSARRAGHGGAASGAAHPI